MGELLELHARPGMPCAPRRTQPAISDADEDHEWILMQRMRNVVELLMRVSKEINATNCCGIEINIEAVRDFIHDELPVKLGNDDRPSLDKWDAKLKEAKYP